MKSDKMSDVDCENAGGASLPDTDLTRRAVLKSLAMLGLSATGLSSTTAAFAAPDSAVKSLITVMSQPGAFPAVCKSVSNVAFAKLYPNVKVDLIETNNATSYPRMLAERNNPVISGSMVNDYFSQRGVKDKMWASFDPKLMTNLPDVPKELVGDQAGIPFCVSPFGIMYNPDKVEAPTSWADLWKPEYKGRVSMWDAYFDAYVMAAHITGGGISVEKGIKAWEPHKANIGAWVKSPVVEADLVDRGDIWLAPHWGWLAEQAHSLGRKINFVVPKEGAVSWSLRMQLTAGFSKEVSELAQIYMNTWISPDYQMEALKKGFVSPVNSKVEIPAGMHSPSIITVADALTKLVRPNYEEIGNNIPKYMKLINQLLKA